MNLLHETVRKIYYQGISKQIEKRPGIAEALLFCRLYINILYINFFNVRHFVVIFGYKCYNIT